MNISTPHPLSDIGFGKARGAIKAAHSVRKRLDMNFLNPSTDKKYQDACSLVNLGSCPAFEEFFCFWSDFKISADNS